MVKMQATAHSGGEMHSSNLCKQQLWGLQQMQAPGHIGFPQQPTHSRSRGIRAWQGVSGSKCHSLVHDWQL